MQLLALREETACITLLLINWNQIWAGSSTSLYFVRLCSKKVGRLIICHLKEYLGKLRNSVIIVIIVISIAPNASWLHLPQSSSLDAGFWLPVVTSCSYTKPGPFKCHVTLLTTATVKPFSKGWWVQHKIRPCNNVVHALEAGNCEGSMYINNKHILENCTLHII